ncbi:MAG TPA: hypothetical protein VGK46_01050 [Saprospiraceae bacterium]
MKFYVLKSFLLAVTLLTVILPAKAQFDDVYYDADLFDPVIKYTYDDPQAVSPEGDVIYYDDDSYEYYDDYDYYYSSRIKRFYHPYVGFGFYDPIYVGYNYYDPYAYDYYGYGGPSIYLNFGIGFGFGSWYAPYYYPYNSWYYPSYSYWGGCGGYYSYGNYCNSYYPSYGHCGGGGGGYYPPYGDHHGDYYYGPRTTGNTGASPRGPQTLPGIVRTDVKSVEPDVTDSNDGPNGLPQPGLPGKVNPSGNPTPGDPTPTPGNPTGVKQDVADGIVRHVPAEPVPTPGNPTGVKQDVADGTVRQIPVDRELPREETPSGPKRPVFKPDVDKYQPYPTPSRPTAPSPDPQVDNTDKPRPSTGGVRPTVPNGNGYQPFPQAERQNDIPSAGEYRPSTPPSGNRPEDRPRYSTPPRPDDRSDDRPSYSPPPRPNDRSDDRPSYSPPPRGNSESRGNDQPSHSAPQRSESQRSYDAPRQSSPSSGGHSSPSGGSSSRSSGGSSGGSSGSSSSSSPRGRG